MGFFKLVYYTIVVTSVTFLILNHAPNLLDFEPQAYTPKLLQFKDGLSVNKDLDRGQFILQGQVQGPEALEIRNGVMYATVEDGKIISIKNDKLLKVVADTSEGGKVSSRPLGLRFYKDDLYVMDAERGLLKVDVNSGDITTLVSKTENVAGTTLNFPDDLDIDDDGVIYFTDMSKKWTIRNVAYGFFEHENSGSVYKYDIKTGKTEMLLDKLYFANGIQLSSDKKSLLIAEQLKNKILRYHLSGPKAGQSEVFAELPGEPDNIRSNPRGGYWVAMVTGRDESSPHLMDYLSTYPKIRKALGKLSYVIAECLDWANHYFSSEVVGSISAELKKGMHLMLLMNVNHPVVVELGADGTIVRSLHSTNPKFAVLSHGLEHDGHLFLGSFLHSYIVKVKL